MNPFSARCKRRLAATLAFASFAAVAGGCKKPAHPAPVSLPVERVLLDASGRELPARVIGRAGDQITVVRLDDGARFDIGIGALSPGDQAFFRAVAEQAPPPPVPRAEIVSPYVQTRRDQIARLREENERLRVETAGTSNEMVKRRNGERLTSNLAEIARMEAQIKAREAEEGKRE